MLFIGRVDCHFEGFGDVAVSIFLFPDFGLELLIGDFDFGHGFNLEEFVVAHDVSM